jgi:HEAT repeat protein
LTPAQVKIVMDDKIPYPNRSKQKQAVLEHLVEIIADASRPPSERHLAKRALCRIGDDNAVTLLEKTSDQSNDITVLTDVIEVLNEIPTSEAVIVALLKMVWHDSPLMRRKAMQALQNKGDDRAIRLLEQIVQESDDPESIFEPDDGQLARQTCERIAARLGLT